MLVFLRELFERVRYGLCISEGYLRMKFMMLRLAFSGVVTRGNVLVIKRFIL